MRLGMVTVSGQSLDPVLAGDHAAVEHDLSKQVIATGACYLQKALLDSFVLNSSV